MIGDASAGKTPEIYKLPIQEVREPGTKKLIKCEVGTRNSRPEKRVLIVGATGAGGLTFFISCHLAFLCIGEQSD